MPPNDQAPRYQLVDPSTGNVVGSVFGDGNGNVVIADETDTQTTFDSDGVTTPALEATDSINDADLTKAGENDYLKKAPSGSELTFEQVQTEPNVPDWTRDPNSPWNLANDGRTISLDGEYDVVRLIFTVQSDVSRTNPQEIKPNPNQSGHSNTVYFKDGSTGTGTPLLAQNTYAASGFVDIDGRWVSDGFDPGDCGIFFGMRTKANSATHAFVENITSPLEEIAIYMDGGAQDADIDVQILGRDLP
jgi:hypothetical protein